MFGRHAEIHFVLFLCTEELMNCPYTLRTPGNGSAVFSIVFTLGGDCRPGIPKLIRYLKVESQHLNTQIFHRVTPASVENEMAE